LSAVNEFLTQDVLKSAEPEITRGRQMTVLEALDNAAISISGRFTDDPSTQVAILLALADAYRSLGRPELGVVHVNKAIELCRKSFPSEDRRTLASTLSLGELLLTQDKLAEAAPVIESTLASAKRALGADDDLTLQTTECLARLKLTQGNLADAEAL